MLPIHYFLSKVSTGNSLPATLDSSNKKKPISTGPGMITPSRVGAKVCEAKHIIYCDDKDAKPYGGRYPLKSASTACPCIDRSNTTICFVHHGGTADAFWWVVETAAKLAATSNGVKLDLRTPDTRDDDEMLKLVKACLETKPNGLVLSIPGPKFESAIKDANSQGVPVISVNSGMDEFKKYGAVLHVGQNEYVAGKGAAKKLHEIIGLTKKPVFLCVDHESGTNAGVSLRCKGIADYVVSVGGTAPGIGNTAHLASANWTDSPHLSVHMKGIPAS